ncbi:hypothetical protein GCM10015535_38510 [Streptomyces gelaticus]|uniref:Uncharacterized protein n=1 Tax=Streptomyces gelaticus TaxID=285446 RepID=A0ABQ2W0H9_9ACTN|nr:hypothetical protein GCM10015535_38510 [Streptomyces gelaticus]
MRGQLALGVLGRGGSLARPAAGQLTQGVQFHDAPPDISLGGRGGTRGVRSTPGTHNIRGTRSIRGGIDRRRHGDSLTAS